MCRAIQVELVYYLVSCFSAYCIKNVSRYKRGSAPEKFGLQCSNSYIRDVSEKSSCGHAYVCITNNLGF